MGEESGGNGRWVGGRRWWEGEGGGRVGVGKEEGKKEGRVERRSKKRREFESGGGCEREERGAGGAGGCGKEGGRGRGCFGKNWLSQKAPKTTT